MLRLVTRYEDGTDRCPDCAAIVPEPEDLEGGGILRREIQHHAWCPRLRLGHLVETPAHPLGRLVEVAPPEPGPIWSNSLAEDVPHAEYTAAELAAAARLLEYFKAELGHHWERAALHFITADLESNGGLDRRSLALLHVIAKEIHHG